MSSEIILPMFYLWNRTTCVNYILANAKENINDEMNRGLGQTKEFLQLETFTLEAKKWKK